MRPHISHTGGAPTTAFSKTFDAKTSYFGMGTSFLPSIDTARTQRKALVGIESPCDHWQYTALDSIENLMRIAGGANTNIDAGRSLLHWRPAGDDEREREAREGRR